MPTPADNPSNPQAELEALFAGGVALDFTAAGVVIEARGLANRWAKLGKLVEANLCDGTAALAFAERVLGVKGGRARAFSTGTVRANFSRGTRPRNEPMVALQVAAALFGDAFEKWPEVLARPAAPPPVTHPRAVRLAVLRGLDIAYTQDIYVGFVAELARRLGGAAQVQLVADRVTGSGGDGELARDAATVLARAREQRADYLVPIGTQAALALKAALGSAFGAGDPCPFLFLGVTYPFKCGLVTVFGSETLERDDVLNTGGVGYGSELNGIATWVLKAWPTDPVRFVYRRGAAQDEEAAQQLRSFEDGGRLRVCEFAHDPTAADLDRLGENAILFSWHTFENMLEHQDGRAALAGRRVVATTRRNVEYGCAAVGYSADDFEIGLRGAELIVEHRGDPAGRALNCFNVKQPKYRYWLNRAALARLRAPWPLPAGRDPDGEFGE